MLGAQRVGTKPELVLQASMPAHLLVLPSASMAAEGLDKEHGLPGIRVHCPALIYTDQRPNTVTGLLPMWSSHLPLAQQETTSVFTQKQKMFFHIFVKLFTKTIRIVDF